MKFTLSSVLSLALFLTIISNQAFVNTTEVHSDYITPELIKEGIQSANIVAQSTIEIANLLKTTTPRLIKIGTINLAGLICSSSGIYVLIKGIQQSCAAHKQKENEHRSFLKRCMDGFTTDAAKGTYQSGMGLVVFLLGLSTAASSERILALYA